SDALAQAAAHFELSELALVSNDYETAAAAAEAGLAACATAIETNEGRRTTKPTSSVVLRPWAFVLETQDDIHLNALAGRGHRLLGAALAMEGGDLPAAERHLQTAVAAHRRADNLADLCATLFELGNVAAQRGELVRALERYEEAARAAEAGHVAYILALAHNNIAYHN